MRSLPIIPAVCLAALASSASGLGVYVGIDRLGQKARWVPVQIAGKIARSAPEAHAILIDEAARAQKRTIALHLAGESKSVGDLSITSLGLEVDVDASLALASSQARSVEPIDVITKQPPVDIPIQWRLRDEAFASQMAAIKETRDVAPVSARLDLEHHTVIPEQAGRYLDVYGAADSLLNEATGAESLALPVVRFAPQVSSDFVKSLEIGQVLSQYETHFSRAGDQARRGQNIDVAATKLDGLVIASGQMVSFNAVVGERSEANGFQKSWEIFKGEMVEGVGGGTCQVASTLHAASFFGGLDVPERLPHSRPSAYIQMGLDSTVVYPAVDLKLRNPHPFPVVVHARTDGNTLKVELLGREKPVTVHFSREVLETIPFPRKLIEETWLSGNKAIHKQHGISGYRIRRVRELMYRNGKRLTENMVDTYPPTADIYQVPVGFDVAKLPPLPAEGEADPKVAQPAPSDLEIVEGKGAHAPTAYQAAPSKSMHLSR